MNTEPITRILAVVQERWESAGQGRRWNTARSGERFRMSLSALACQSGRGKTLLLGFVEGPQNSLKRG